MNRNTLQAELLVEALIGAGVRHVCLSPGSRNTPLVLAFAKRDDVRVTSHLDERCAAFFALGIGVATGVPAVLVCTSGSAAANYFPAIVEAHQSHVPMIVITADRPHELRHSGANQTIDQDKMYGGYALWSVDLPLPEAAPAALAFRNLRSTAARAVAIARGERRGVVHLNAPFRPPLEPTAVPGDVIEAPVMEAHVQIPVPAPRAADAQQIATCAAQVKKFARGVIVCGPGCGEDGFRERVLDLAEATGYPILADALSGVRFGPDRPGVLVSGAYETYLHPQSAIGKALPKPELVLRFGNVPTSKWLNQFLDEAKPKAVLHVCADGVWADDSHRVTHLIQADPGEFARQLVQERATYARRASDAQRTSELDAYRSAERAASDAWQNALTAGAWFDAVAVQDVIDGLPDGATLFAGNSLPVRHVDQFGASAGRRLFVHANRGASGIDGNVSTALGIGHARPAQVLAALLGDVTLYHDMNGLLAVKRCGVPITLVVLNNNGGGIFRRLAVKDFDPPFTEYFATPHGLNFEPVAQLYGLDYVRARDRAHFREAVAASVSARASTLIEVTTDAQMDFDARAAVIQAASASFRWSVAEEMEK